MIAVYILKNAKKNLFSCNKFSCFIQKTAAKKKTCLN